MRVPKEETSMVSDLRYGWKKLRKLAAEVADNLNRLQVGNPGRQRCRHDLQGSCLSK